MIYYFKELIEKYRILCLNFNSLSLSMLHCYICNSNLELTKWSPDFLVWTRIGILLEPTDELLLSTQVHWCDWSLWQPLFQISIQLLCYLVPKLQYFMDLTTLNRKKTLDKKTYTLMRNFHFSINSSHLINSFNFRWQSSMNT